MSLSTLEIIQGLYQQFEQEELDRLPLEERRQLERAFEARFSELIKSAGGDADDGFVDLLGFGSEGVRPFDRIAYPHIEADFDESITPSQLQAAAELYFLYQHERMGVFQAIRILRKLFREGRIRIQRGPGARALYLLEKWQPLRYGPKDRAIAYMRVFNYGKAPRPAGAVINKNFHYQWVALMSSLAQYFRDLTVGEVIRGSGTIDQRPFGAIASVQRLATDLRYALDRASYGNIVALTHESGLYLNEVLRILDAPDIKRAFDANNRWLALEQILNRHLGGAKELSHRAKMAEAGRRVMKWVAGSDFDSDVDPETFRAQARVAGSHAEAWIAAYRLTSEGRRFPGANAQLRWSLGLPRKQAEAELV